MSTVAGTKLATPAELMNTSRYFTSESGKTYLVVPRIYNTEFGNERCEYLVVDQGNPVARCELTSQVHYAITKLESSTR